MKFKTFCAAMALLFTGAVFADIEAYTAEKNFNTISQIDSKNLNNQDDSSEEPYIFEGDEFYDAKDITPELQNKINNAIKHNTKHAPKKSSSLNPNAKRNFNPMTEEEKAESINDHLHRKIRDKNREISQFKKNEKLMLSTYNNAVSTLQKNSNSSVRGLDTSSNVSIQISKIKRAAQELSSLINRNITEETIEIFKKKHSRLMNYIKELEVLLKAKPTKQTSNVNNKGNSVKTLKQKFSELMKYIRDNNVNEATKIITSVLDKNTKEALLNAADQYGCTPLWIAAKQNERPMIELLLNNGANINYTLLKVIDSNRGEEQERKHFSTEVVQILLDHGADANAKFEDDGTTVLSEVILGNFSLKDKYYLVKVLMNHDANPNLPDNEGRTPLYYVSELNNENEKADKNLDNIYKQRKISPNDYKKNKKMLKNRQILIENIKQSLTSSKSKSEPISKKVLNFAGNKLKQYVGS